LTVHAASKHIARCWIIAKKQIKTVKFRELLILRWAPVFHKFMAPVLKARKKENDRNPLFLLRFQPFFRSFRCGFPFSRSMLRRIADFSILRP